MSKRKRVIRVDSVDSAVEDLLKTAQEAIDKSEEETSEEGQDQPSPVTRVEIELPRLVLVHTEVNIVGQSPLIVHKWSDKAKEMMLAKQTKRASAGRAAKDPNQDYLDSLYHYPGGGYGFPSTGFKAAAVRAGTYANMKMTFLRGAFHVTGEQVKINGQPRPREDMVRVGNGVADIRYRGEFPEWNASVPIVFNSNAISLEQIINLFNIAGFSVGIGEWRPERDGQYGRFKVVTE